MVRPSVIVAVFALCICVCSANFEGQYNSTGVSGVSYLSICNRFGSIYGAYGGAVDEAIGFFTLTSSSATVASGTSYEITAWNASSVYTEGTVTLTFGSAAQNTYTISHVQGAVTKTMTGFLTNATTSDQYCLYGNTTQTFTGLWLLAFGDAPSTSENETICINNAGNTVASTYFYYDPVTSALVPGTNTNFVPSATPFRMIGRYCDSECGGQIYYMADGTSFWNYFYGQNGAFIAPQRKVRSESYSVALVGSQCVATFTGAAGSLAINSVLVAALSLISIAVALF